MKITAIGVEVWTAIGSLHWCLDFRDMDSPAIILLCDAYGRKGGEGGGFVLCPLFGRKCKAFIATSGASNTSILTRMVRSFSFQCSTLLLGAGECDIIGTGRFHLLEYPWRDNHKQPVVTWILFMANFFSRRSLFSGCFADKHGKIVSGNLTKCWLHTNTWCCRVLEIKRWDLYLCSCLYNWVHSLEILKAILGKSVGPQDWVCCHYYNTHPVLSLQLSVFCIFSFWWKT